MPSVFVRSMLFISSYFPLTLIFFVFLFQDHLLWAIIVLAIGSIGLLCTFVYFFRILPKYSPIQQRVTGRHARGADVMGYIASYVIPFVTFPLATWQQVAALLIFIGMLGTVYINSEDMIRINPMLNLVGYHLYEITVEHGEDSYALITRRRVRRGDTVHLIDAGKGIFLERTV